MSVLYMIPPPHAQYYSTPPPPQLSSALYTCFLLPLKVWFDRNKIFWNEIFLEKKSWFSHDLRFILLLDPDPYLQKVYGFGSGSCKMRRIRVDTDPWIITWWIRIRQNYMDSDPKHWFLWWVKQMLCCTKMANKSV